MAAPAPVPADAALGVSMVCAGCGWRSADDDPFPIRCSRQRPGDDIDHVMTRLLDPGRVAWPAARGANPFLRYRTLCRAWHRARAAGWDDARYVALVKRLDAAVAAVDGHGFRVTPLRRWAGLGGSGGVWVKDETRNVSGSHKARHLMGVALELAVAEANGGPAAAALAGRPLAIASCGNAALAAAIVARGAARTLHVFVLSGADPAVMERLSHLGAQVTVCQRAPGRGGDPSVRAMQAAIADGAIPFTCQGTENGLAIEGGQTLGWELADQLRDAGERLDTLAVQVGGGALASAVVAGLLDARALGRLDALPRIVAVQSAGGYPLVRAWDRVAALARDELGWRGEPLDVAAPSVVAFLERVAHRRSAFMWPWENEPVSVAHGILDDETYDWLAIVRGLLATGGRAIVADEVTLRTANERARIATHISVDPTGSAGYAGVLALAAAGDRRPDERIGVLFTGIRRDHPPQGEQP